MISLLFQTLLIALSVSVDAFAVSISSGLKYNKKKFSELIIIPLTFGFFQFIMPIVGYIIPNVFIKNEFVYKNIDYVAFIILELLGFKMILIDKNKKSDAIVSIDIIVLLLEGLSTSIDALSVGLTLYKYDFRVAFINCIIIGIVTFLICVIGILIGKYYGNKYKNNAFVFAGIIFILIGLKIFITKIV